MTSGAVRPHRFPLHDLEPTGLFQKRGVRIEIAHQCRVRHANPIFEVHRENIEAEHSGKELANEDPILKMVPGQLRVAELEAEDPFLREHSIVR